MVTRPSWVGREDSSRIPPPRWHRAPRRRLLLCVGRGDPVSPKSLRLVFEVLGILRWMHDPEICLTVSGLESGTVVESAPEGVTFRSATSARELVALFDSHDLLIVPSGVGAGGLPEALSRGIPCVTVGSCTMSEAVMSGITGAVIEDGSTYELAAGIASVLEDDGIYRSCFERAPAMAAYFAWMRLPYGDLPHLLA